MPDEIFTKSVTADDLGKVRNGAVLQLIVPFYQGSDRIPLPPQIPPYWSYQQDLILRSTIFNEPMWAAALGIAITKVASLSFQITGKTTKKKLANLQRIFINADGRMTGWVNFLAKHLRDYLTTNNGSFIEIVRQTKAIGSPIVGLRHLDSLRCQRTGDPDIPIIYRDKWGKLHEMKQHQVMSFSEMPDPSDTYYGVGICAAHRAYYSVYKLASIEQYLREKVTGIRPLAIYIVNGVLDQQLKNAVSAAKQEEVSRGLVSYMGAVIIGVPDEMQPQLVTIPLAELPDRFNRKEEFDIAVLSYADNLGLDVQDLQPLGGQSLGTGVQSQILHDKATGKGLVTWRQSFIHLVNEYIMPDGVTFNFMERDYRDLQQKAALSLARAQVSAARVTAQITTAKQELQVLISEDELPKDFLLEAGIAPANVELSLTDDESPDSLDFPKPPAVREMVQELDQNGQPVIGVDGQPVLTPKPRIWGLPDEQQPDFATVAVPVPPDPDDEVKKVEGNEGTKVWTQKDAEAPMGLDYRTSLLGDDVIREATRIYRRAIRNGNGRMPISEESGKNPELEPA